VNADHAGVRMDDGSGIFDAPNRALLPPDHCLPAAQKGCYAFILHPRAQPRSVDLLQLPPQADLTLPNGRIIGSIRIGRTCAAEFNGGTR
jgi:hypothetical protein